MIKRYVERRSREAAQVTVTPVDTVQYCSPPPLNPEIPSDVHVKMEEKGEDSKLKKLKPPSADTGLETLGQQCPPNEGSWEKGRTIADGYLLVSMGSNPRGRHFFTHDGMRGEPSELRRTSLSCSRATNPKTRRKAAKKTNSSTLVGKEESSHHHGMRL